ncbi:hypothetical protein F5Y11DRAFT_282747 [Daldinia sp. FL1419]|nr:hypothetical protein F5Y11DRAFT_282747 [Daldinia sp. FL1419]
MITPQTKDAEEMEHVVTNCLLELLLGSKLVGVAALALAAVGGTGREAEDQVEGRLLLNVVVGEGSAILKLLTSEDQALLVGGDTLLVLDLGLDIVDGVGRLHLKGDGLARQGLHEAIFLSVRMFACSHIRISSVDRSAILWCAHYVFELKINLHLHYRHILVSMSQFGTP